MSDESVGGPVDRDVGRLLRKRLGVSAAWSDSDVQSVAVAEIDDLRAERDRWRAALIRIRDMEQAPRDLMAHDMQQIAAEALTPNVGAKRAKLGLSEVLDHL